ncbi:MAG: VWA domain-containing protein [Thermomicrobiales bacterium]
MQETNPFALAELVDNPEQRCPVVLVLDVSSSMQGKAISELNAGLAQFARDLKNDSLASLRVEVAIVTFGGTAQAVDVRNGRASAIANDPAQAFAPADAFSPPTLQASGGTPMGDAVAMGLDLLRGRKAIYREHGIPYFRPWMFVVSDGAPTDENWVAAAEQARLEESQKGVSVFPIGVDAADMGTLAMFSSQRSPAKLAGIEQFQSLFRWLSGSVAAVANSRPGEVVTLPAAGWATIDPS